MRVLGLGEVNATKAAFVMYDENSDSWLALRSNSAEDAKQEVSNYMADRHSASDCKVHIFAKHATIDQVRHVSTTRTYIAF